MQAGRMIPRFAANGRADYAGKALERRWSDIGPNLQYLALRVHPARSLLQE